MKILEVVHKLGDETIYCKEVRRAGQDSHNFPLVIPREGEYIMGVNYIYKVKSIMYIPAVYKCIVHLEKYQSL